MPCVRAPPTSRSGCPRTRRRRSRWWLTSVPPGRIGVRSDGRAGDSAMKASLWAMIVEGWLPRAARRGPGGWRCETPRRRRLLRRAARRRERRARPSWPRAASGPGSASRSRCRRGSPSRGRCTPACCSAPSRCRSICGLTAAERERVTAGAAVLVEEPLATVRRPRRRGSLRRRRATIWSATAVVIHTSGTTSAPKPIELTYGNFLWSALGSAVALGLDPRERWLCALPLSHVGGLSILLRSTIYATTAVLHERFDDRAPSCRRCGAGDHARLARRHHARAPAGCGPASVRRRCAAR